MTGDGDRPAAERRRQVLTDGLLALVVFVVLVVAAVARAVEVLALPAALGVAGTALFELAATLDDGVRRRVRAVWERPAVRVGSLVVTLAVGAAVATAVPALVVSVGLGAVGAYLVVVAAVLVSLD